MKSRSRKAQVDISIVMNPFFVISIGIIVSIITLLAIRDLGSSTEFEKQFYATDLGLSMDALHAVRPDVNYHFTYLANKKYGYLFESKKVIVYEKEKKDGQAFYYTEDPHYALHYGEYKPGTQDKISFFRTGMQLGIAKETPQLVFPYCEVRPPVKVSATINHQNVQQFGTNVTTYADGELHIVVNVKPGQHELILYTNAKTDSAQLACELAKEYATHNQLRGYTIIPLNPKHLAPDDSRKTVAQHQGIAVYAEITQPPLTPTTKAQLGQTLQKVVTSHVI